MNKSLLLYDAPKGRINKAVTNYLHTIIGNESFSIIPAAKFKKGYNDSIINKYCNILNAFIVIKGCPVDFNYESFFNVITDGIFFDSKWCSGWFWPKFIFITEKEPAHRGKSFNDRINIESVILHF